jgi:peptidyl-prolyl cis-trans isomerase SurA
MQGISISEEQLNNVMNSIAESNNLSIEGLIKEIEVDGSSFSEFRETVRIQLLYDQVKKRVIGANIKISEFEIDNFIELQKERAPTKYNYSHILLENIQNNDDNIDVEKQKIN